MLLHERKEIFRKSELRWFLVMLTHQLFILIIKAKHIISMYVPMRYKLSKEYYGHCVKVKFDMKRVWKMKNQEVKVKSKKDSFMFSYYYFALLYLSSPNENIRLIIYNEVNEPQHYFLNFSFLSARFNFLVAYLCSVLYALLKSPEIPKPVGLPSDPPAISQSPTNHPSKNE